MIVLQVLPPRKQFIKIHDCDGPLRKHVSPKVRTFDSDDEWLCVCVHVCAHARACVCLGVNCVKYFLIYAWGRTLLNKWIWGFIFFRSFYSSLNKICYCPSELIRTNELKPLPKKGSSVLLIPDPPLVPALRARCIFPVTLNRFSNQEDHCSEESVYWWLSKGLIPVLSKTQPRFHHHYLQSLIV